MRALRLAFIPAALFLASAAAAQESVEVALHLRMPDVLELRAEPESVVQSGAEREVRGVRLRVRANRTWSLLVSCRAASGAGAAPEGTDGGSGIDGAAAGAVLWRPVVNGAAMQACGLTAVIAAEGGRSNDTLVALEYETDVGSRSPLRFTLVPR